jgi:hypothetical protein
VRSCKKQKKQKGKKKKRYMDKNKKNKKKRPIPLHDLQSTHANAKIQKQSPKARAALKPSQDKTKFIIFPSSSPKSTSLLIARQVYRQVQGIRAAVVVLLGVAVSRRLSAFRRTCRPCTWVCRSCERRLLVNASWV